MLQWLKKKFSKPVNPYSGLFEGWTIDDHYATDPEGHFCLWIANGIDHFRDADGYRGRMLHRRLLVNVTRAKKLQIWAALHAQATDLRNKEHDDSIRYLRSARELAPHP